MSGIYWFSYSFTTDPQQQLPRAAGGPRGTAVKMHQRHQTPAIPDGHDCQKLETVECDDNKKLRGQKAKFNW